MGGLSEDLRRALEASREPLEVSVLLKTIERESAKERGEPVPEYSEEELRELRRHDEEDARGEGVVGRLRNAPGWQLPESQKVLDEWQHEARRRLTRHHDRAEKTGLGRCAG